MKKRLAEFGLDLKRHIAFYRAIYRDPRTPFLARVLLWLAVAYALLPFDLIPDFIPVIGHLDDLVIVPALVWLAIRMIPQEVQQEYRQRFLLDAEPASASQASVEKPPTGG